VEHPLPYHDTDPRAMEVWLDLLRKKPAGEKIKATLDLSGFALNMAEAGVRARYPQASEREVFLRTAALHLNCDLLKRAYGWDPKQHEESGRRV
jgi:hypothetical protein